MIKKKELLNEIMGVPKDLTPWVKSLSQLIFNDASKMDHWDEEGPVHYVNKEGDEQEGTAYRLNLQEIHGKEVMDFLAKNNGFNNLKEFINSEIFKKVPLWRPEITYKIVGLPSELYDLEGDGRINASVGGNVDQELSKVGKVDVFPGVKLHFDILVDKDKPLRDLKKNLSDTISHELLHTYQKIKQLEGGRPSHFGKEMVLNAIIQNPIIDNIDIGWWKKFLNLIYLHLSFEVNARVTQLYYLLKEKNINTKEDFLIELKKSSMWEQMKRLEDFNAEEYIKSFKLPNEEFEGNNPLQMLDNMMQKVTLASQGVNPKSKEDALKSLIGLWDKTLDIGNVGMKQMGMDITMDNVPKSAKESPLKFFKFFEKRFHKKADKWKRKLYRIGALLLQEKDEALQKD